MPEPEPVAPVKIRPDDATIAWLERLAAERYGGDLGRCVEAVLREARVAAEGLPRRGVLAADLPSDPWHSLEVELRQRRRAGGV